MSFVILLRNMKIKREREKETLLSKGSLYFFTILGVSLKKTEKKRTIKVPINKNV